MTRTVDDIRAELYGLPPYSQRLKHGPKGSGLIGPCDVDCRKCQLEAELDAIQKAAPFEGLRGVALIHALVRAGKISAEDAAALLELRRELAWRSSWQYRLLDCWQYRLLDWITLGPLGRWVVRKLRLD